MSNNSHKLTLVQEGHSGNPETQLLLAMTTPEGMEAVVKAGLGPDVFEEPFHESVFRIARDHWDKYQKPPTRQILIDGNPGITKRFDRYPLEIEDLPPAGYLIERLQKRYLFNQMQDRLLEAANTASADPEGAARKLIEGCQKVLSNAGKKTDLDETPKVRSARDLKGAEQPRWLANGRMARDVTDPPTC